MIWFHTTISRYRVLLIFFDDRRGPQGRGAKFRSGPYELGQLQNGFKPSHPYLIDANGWGRNPHILVLWSNQGTDAHIPNNPVRCFLVDRTKYQLSSVTHGDISILKSVRNFSTIQSADDANFWYEHSLRHRERPLPSLPPNSSV